MIAITEAQQFISQIREDREHGASELARTCLDALARHTDSIEVTSNEALRRQLIELAQELQSARSTMAAITNLIGEWIAAVERLPAGNVSTLRDDIKSISTTLILASENAVSSAAAHAAELVGTGKTIITHSLSSTVVAVFERLVGNVKAIVTESRPPSEGRRLAAKLSELGIETDFISDQQMGLFAKRADVALVGADTIAGDGSVIDKAGTYLLALAARDRGSPFYVCFESFKHSHVSPVDVALEEHDPAEIDPSKLAHVKAHNIYFDVTPPELVTAWISEHGISNES
ncbi:MAG: translation initiation factor eIF-2B, partial [Acidiferrobacterales bacterium]